MSIGRALGLLCGSMMIYVAMAACSGTSDIVLMGSASGGGGKGGSGAGVGGILDPVPDASAGEPPGSGTRLKKVRYVGDDGSVEDTSVWYDTKRNEQCGVVGAADGLMRCLPRKYAGVLTVYGDTGCQMQRVIAVSIPVPCGAVTPKYGFESVPGVCNSYTVRPVTVQIFTQLYSKDALGTCKPWAVPANATAFDVGPPIDPSEFVAFTLKTDP